MTEDEELEKLLSHLEWLNGKCEEVWNDIQDAGCYDGENEICADLWLELDDLQRQYNATEKKYYELYASKPIDN